MIKNTEPKEIMLNLLLRDIAFALKDSDIGIEDLNTIFDIVDEYIVSYSLDLNRLNIDDHKRNRKNSEFVEFINASKASRTLKRSYAKSHKHSMQKYFLEDKPSRKRQKKIYPDGSAKHFRWKKYPELDEIITDMYDEGYTLKAMADAIKEYNEHPEVGSGKGAIRSRLLKLGLSTKGIDKKVI